MSRPPLCAATDAHPRNTEASCVVRDDGTLLLAWSRFAAGARDDSQAAIAGITSADQGATWSQPFVLKENDGRMNVMSPSLLALASGDLVMLHLRKDSHSSCTGFLRRSTDGGRTWSEAVRVTPNDAYNGVVNDALLQLPSGRLLAPMQTGPECWSPREHYVALACYSDDDGRSWQTSRNHVDVPQRGAMEPGIVQRRDGSLLMYLRTQLGRQWGSVSEDAGESWSEPFELNIVSPEAPAKIRSLPDGRWVLVWNHSHVAGANHSGPRRPLSLAMSADEGSTWTGERALEDDAAFTYAYPSICLVGDRLLISYYRTPEQSGLGQEHQEARLDLMLQRVSL